MRYTYFEIENFKGIQKIKIDLEKTPQLDVYTLVGLNESGKTTILEAINSFSYKKETLEPLDLSRYAISNVHDLIPIGKRDNFNDRIIIKVGLQLGEEDEKKIKKYLSRECDFSLSKDIGTVEISQVDLFENSKHIETKFYWDFDVVGKKYRQRIDRSIGDKEDEWMKTADYIEKLIPTILYFPNFLFDFPDKIYLGNYTDVPDVDKHELYRMVIQDILDALGTGTNYETHILERARSSERADKRNLEGLLLKMGRHVTSIVFEAWNKIFRRQLTDKEIIIVCDSDEKDHFYLEFKIKDSDGYYRISERSLGFRWFFVFLLLTQYRGYRKGSPTNVLFLFDEPASNLHATAQSQLLNSLDKLKEKSKVIYTTHSHHLINPDWLEGAFVVKNEGLDYKNDDELYSSRKTNIVIERYRTFASKYPDQKTYFQPILDILDYCPSRLEMVPEVVMCEGKHDYYGLNYFCKIIFHNRFNVHIMPSLSGAGGLDEVIQLYIGWGKNFVVLLDSDSSGIKEKCRYNKDFGEIVRNRIYTLEDIDSSWTNCELEDLITKEERFEFQKISYPESQEYNKKHFNRALQENFIRKISYNFSASTKNKFENIFTFLSEALKSNS